MSKFKTSMAFLFKTALVTGIAIDAFHLGRYIHDAYHTLDEADALADGLIDQDGCDNCCCPGRVANTQETQAPAEKQKLSGKMPEDLLPTVGAAEAMNLIQYACNTVNPALVIESAISALQTYLDEHAGAMSDAIVEE